MGNLMQKLTPEEVRELEAEKQPPIFDTVVEQVRHDLLNRSKVGIKKYGTTLDRNDLSHKEWLQLAYEEALDMALYLKRAMR